jgi:hypothetical protein
MELIELFEFTRLPFASGVECFSLRRVNVPIACSAGVISFQWRASMAIWAISVATLCVFAIM